MRWKPLQSNLSSGREWLFYWGSGHWNSNNPACNSKSFGLFPWKSDMLYVTLSSVMSLADQSVLCCFPPVSSVHFPLVMRSCGSSNAINNSFMILEPIGYLWDDAFNPSFVQHSLVSAPVPVLPRDALVSPAPCTVSSKSLLNFCSLTFNVLPEIFHSRQTDLALFYFGCPTCDITRFSVCAKQSTNCLGDWFFNKSLHTVNLRCHNSSSIVDPNFGFAFIAVLKVKNCWS